jgi:lysophospholipase L1-like esterase
VLLAASLLACLLVAEAAVRLVAPAHRTTGYAPVAPRGRDAGPVNAKGYRDLERAVPRPEAVRRAVCIGDSFTWGVSVLFDDAWPQRLERTLSRERGERWEAVNLAEPGLNAVQEASRLAAEGFAYEPDVVVVGWVLNDSEDETAAEARRAADWAQERRRGAPPAVLERSALARLVRARVRATVENRRRVEGFRSMYADDYAGWVAARRALRAMGGMCREGGVPLVVAIFPLFGNPLDERYPFAEAHAKVAQAAGEAGAKVVDLLPHYRGLDWKLLVVDGADDEHPNEIAHRIAARAIARAVDEVVPRAPRAP